jgi:uncharacterized membrane protein YgdD (TMEM256/DUF423 family)
MSLNPPIQLTSIVPMLAGAFFGLLAVILGALGAHALKSVLTPEQMVSYDTGVRFQMYHALLLLFVGLLYHILPDIKFKGMTTGMLIAGVLCFSGSIYLLTLLRLKAVALATPLGGLLLIIGWLLLAWSLLRYYLEHRS